MIYGAAVPWYLRMLGVWGIEDSTYRAWWGEFSARWGFGLGYSVYHEHASVRIQLVWGALYLKMPMLIKQRDGTEDWNATYGISYFGRTFHLNWRTRCKILHMPWDWEHVRHDYLNPDGSLHHRAQPHEYSPPSDSKQTFQYTYTLRNGTVQNRMATVNGEEREWRWRWFTWLPWPRWVQRTINIEFNDEVGERTGSWKGGTIGCGWEWRPGETLEQALTRMQHEREFT